MSLMKWTQVSVQGWCGILVTESHLKMSSDFYPSFLTFIASWLDEERALIISTPFPRLSHCIPSLAGRHGFPRSTSSWPVWGPSFPGQSLPLPSPAPGRHPGHPAAGSPVRSCSRRVVSQAAEERSVWKRLKLCWSISWSTEKAWASWSWLPSTISWGKAKSIPSCRQRGESLLICPRRTDRSEGRVSSFGPGAWSSSCQPACGSETGHSPGILPGRSWPVPGPSVEGARRPWGKWGCCWAGGDGVWWNPEVGSLMPCFLSQAFK